jgi:hypothetical protein
MNELVAALGSIVRGAVVAAGAGLVTNGYATDSDVQALGGAAAIAVGIIASLIRNRFLKKKMEA